MRRPRECGAGVFFGISFYDLFGPASYPTPLWFAISPRGRRLDGDGLAGVEHCRVAAGEFFHPPVVPAHGVLADFARAATRKPERTHPAVA